MSRYVALAREPWCSWQYPITNIVAGPRVLLSFEVLRSTLIKWKFHFEVINQLWHLAWQWLWTFSAQCLAFNSMGKKKCLFNTVNWPMGDSGLHAFGNLSKYATLDFPNFNDQQVLRKPELPKKAEKNCFEFMHIWGAWVD